MGWPGFAAIANIHGWFVRFLPSAFSAFFLRALCVQLRFKCALVCGERFFRVIE